MRPNENKNIMPSTVTRFVWSDEVLKAGLGIYRRGSREVDDFFHQNPEVLLEFENMDREILEFIEVCRRRGINGLRAKKAELDEKALNNYNPKKIKLDPNDVVMEGHMKRKMLNLNY